MEKVKFAIPAGSLAKATFEILQRSGYKVSGQERTYRPTINDPQIELKILRPQEIPVFVSEGLQDPPEPRVWANKIGGGCSQSLKQKLHRRNHGEFMAQRQKLPRLNRIPEHRVRVHQKQPSLQETFRCRRPHDCDAVVAERRKFQSKNIPILRRHRS
jgi:hypothetical protein